MHKNLLLALVGAALTAVSAATLSAADSVAVTDHTVIAVVSKPGVTHPDAFIIKIEVSYRLESMPKAIIRLAVDKESETSFAFVDEDEVVSQKKKRKIEMEATITGFKRDVLRGVVFLTDPDAGPEDKPLAGVGVSIELKKFRTGNL
jgi:hypothetical protein